MAANNNNNSSSASEKKRKVDATTSVSKGLQHELDDGVSILTFSGVSHQEHVHFFIDYSNTYKTLVDWVKQIQKQASVPYSHLVIDGLVKMGKTTVLTTLLPLVLQEIETDYTTFTIDFLDYPAKCTLDFLGRLYQSLVQGFTKLGVHPPPAPAIVMESTLQEAILGLFVELSVQLNGKVYFLFDEIQRWFQLPQQELERFAMYNFFKKVVSSSDGRRVRQYFVITGSGMITAWSAYAKVAPNGHSIHQTAWRLHLTPVADSKIAGVCIRHLKKEFPDFKAVAGVELETLLAAAPSKSPSSLVYLAVFIYRAQPQSNFNLDALIQQSEAKYFQEYMSDFPPLTQDISPAIRQLLRHLARGIAVDPKPLLDSYFGTFFQPFIVPIDSQDPAIRNAWDSEFPTAPPPPAQLFGFPPSAFNWISEMVIMPNGSVNENTLQRWHAVAQFPVTMFNYRLIEAFAALGNKLEDMNPVWRSLAVAADLKNLMDQVENCCTAFFQKHGVPILAYDTYHADPLFSFLIGPQSKNGANVKVMTTHGVFTNPHFGYWYCTMFKMIRNHFAHSISDLSSMAALAAFLPPWKYAFALELSTLPSLSWFRSFFC